MWTERSNTGALSLPHRRAVLQGAALGFGAIAMRGLLDEEQQRLLPASLAQRIPARAKRVIFLFMHGGPSQIDTFDYKPLLQRDDGKPFPGQRPRVNFAKTETLMASPWKFAQHGQSGAWVSALFPEVAQVADRLCFVKSLHGTNPAHGGALLALHTGSDTFVRPSMGSWITYGLGTENQSLPGFITICPTLGHGGVANWSNAFLPAQFAGVPLGHAGLKAQDAKIAFVDGGDEKLQPLQLEALKAINAQHVATRPEEGALAARIAALETGFRMQRTAADLTDLSGESAATLALYGVDEAKTEKFGRQCLLARRSAEAGVRFIQCTHSYKWDQHEQLKGLHESNAAEVDKPIAGLIKDLAAHGLLDDTLVLWAGEFGRTPTRQGAMGEAAGRDHNPHGFTVFMAGGGVKPGCSYGATDDYGWFAAENKVHVHDLHATLLHILGIDHEKLTFRHAGRDFRLTDTAGNVIHDILA
ncbi:MAG: DUF1501 domain-containing protein [Planctomycetes bacterium]|nr:DUF1501 domain-containing protein [Planctomycetota bacterium]